MQGVRAVVKHIQTLARRYVFNRVERKLIAAFLVIVLVPLLGTAFYGNWVTSSALRRKDIENARADLMQRASRIETYLAGVQGDVLFLSRLTALNALIRARQHQDEAAIAYWRERVGKEFYTFAQTHPDYYQIRYIAEDGMEFVRINARRGMVEIVPRSQLQQKGHRYYFQEAMHRPPGDIYVSPVDLNREFGQLEVPYTPVVRYATPVFYPDGSRAGIVIINLYAGEFLRYVSEGHLRGELALADQDGYYLVHPDPSKVWGHPWDLATGYRLHMDFPRHWPEILAPKPGLVSTGDRVVVHVPVFPNKRDGQRYWVLLHVEPKSEIFASVQAFRVTAAGILIVAIMWAVTAAVFLARGITAPVLALTESVRRFGRGESHMPIAVESEDEIGELARAFDEMARALQQNLERLSRLNRASRRIAAQLEHEHVLTAVLDAADELFNAEYKVVRLMRGGQCPGEPITDAGDTRWAAMADSDGARHVREQALTHNVWQAGRLSTTDGEPAYVCCAPLQCRSRGQGVIELYGRDPALADQTTGNLLAALALQASIAMENADLYSRLAEHRQRLQTLVEQLITAQEEERRIVAYDIHDGLVQRLVGARLHLLNFAALQEQGCEGAKDALQKAIDHITASIVEARRVIEGLRPAMLDDLGLIPALEQYAQDLGADVGWTVVVDAPANFPRLPSIVEITAFRIAQEALNNARKYAEAQSVTIRLGLEDSRLTLEVVDDGKGFDMAHIRENSHCFGIIGMQERAYLLGGECTIHSAPGEGTRVWAVLPIQVRAFIPTV